MHQFQSEARPLQGAINILVWTRVKYTRMRDSPLDILLRNCHTLRSIMGDRKTIVEYAGVYDRLV